MEALHLQNLLWFFSRSSEPAARLAPLGRGAAAGLRRGNTAGTRSLLPPRLLSPLDRTPLLKRSKCSETGNIKLTVFARVLQSFRTGNSESLQTVFHNQESAPLRPSSCSGAEQSPCGDPTADYRRAGPGCGAPGLLGLSSPLLQTFLLTRNPTFPPLIPRCQVTANTDATSGPTFHNNHCGSSSQQQSANKILFG